MTLKQALGSNQSVSGPFALRLTLARLTVFFCLFVDDFPAIVVRTTSKSKLRFVDPGFSHEGRNRQRLHVVHTP